MDHEKEADIIGLIAEMLVNETKPFSDGALLYCEAEWNAASVSMFRDEGDIVRYVDRKTRIFDPIFDLWNIAENGKKWSGLVMTIEGNSFNVRFEYAEDWQSEEWEGDRRERLLAAKYGNKKIVYPSLEDGDQTSGSSK